MGDAAAGSRDLQLQSFSGYSSSDESLEDALKQAVKQNVPDQVRSLLSRSAEVNCRFTYGLTPLHLAALHGHLEIATILRTAGADPHVRTTDGINATPLKLASMEHHAEVVELLLSDPPVKNPIQRRFLGPALICVVVLINVGVWSCLIHSHWDGWEEARDVANPGVLAVLRQAWVGGVVCIVCLVLVNVLDPGSVKGDELDGSACAFQRLGEDDPKATLIPSVNERIAAGDAGVPARWCTVCQLVRPPDVAHCQICQRCFWRHDHHCEAVGTCIAARNHAAFAFMLLSGGASWAACVAGVLLHILEHGAASLGPLAWLARPQLLGALSYAIVGVPCSLVLLTFGTFHFGALIFNFNTRKLWKGQFRTGEQVFCQLNDARTCSQIFSTRLECRECQVPANVVTIETTSATSSTSQEEEESSTAAATTEI